MSNNKTIVMLSEAKHLHVARFVAKKCRDMDERMFLDEMLHFVQHDTD
jgi:hypothetical protein